MKKFLAVCFSITAGFATASDIVINEIMYHDATTDLEFVELYNASASDVSIQDWYLLDDNDTHTHCRLTGTLQAGAYWIVPGNTALFKARFPAVTGINPNAFGAGNNGWSLGNSGDEVRLFTNAGVLHDIVTYEDGGDWPGSPDGDGPSLELMNPLFDNSLPSSWRSSMADGGTPGQINSVYTGDAAPVCRNGIRLVDLPTAADAVTVSVVAFDVEGPVNVQMMVSTGVGYTPMTMNDGGTGGDPVAGDSLFSVVIPAQPSGTLVTYYAIATDNFGQTDTWPKQAPVDYHAYTVGYRPPKLRITELMAANNSTARDGSGDYDDWFEIHNEENVPVNVGGMFVTASFNSPRKFQLPARTIAPDDYLLLWADDETDQGPLHTDFKLSADGEEIAIFETVDHGNVMIHGWKYGRMGQDISMGFLPGDATAPEYLSPATPDASNAASRVYSPVCINEFQSTSDFGGPDDDWIEIYNRGSASYDLAGCFLSDERNDNTKWIFPQNVSTLKPGEYLVIYESGLKFGLSSDGDDVIMLTASDSTTGLDFYDFGPQVADKSEGRNPDGSAYWTSFSPPTKGSSNINSAVSNDGSIPLPQEITLYANYPNPFNPETSIDFFVPSRQWVSLKVYNSTGQETAVLADGYFERGLNTLTWNAANHPSGVYFYMLTGDGVRKMRKMLLLK